MRIVICGDSTASFYDVDRAPRTGWGQALGARGGLDVRNHALSGASTRSFIAAGLLEDAASDLRPGDLLLICFGHNDPKPDERFSDPVAFAANLRRFVAAAWERGATPVLLTPVERREFVDGRAQPTHGEYPGRTRALARDEGLVLIDLTRETRALWDRMGPERSKAPFLWLEPGEWPGYPAGEQDDTHLSAGGAALVAGLVATALVDAGLLGTGVAAALAVSG